MADLVSEEFIDASFIMSPGAGVLGLVSRDYTYCIWGQRTGVRGQRSEVSSYQGFLLPAWESLNYKEGLLSGRQ